MGADAVDVTEVTGIDLPESSLPPGDGSRSMTQEFDQAVDKGIDKAASEDVRQTITPKDPETALDKSMDQAAPEHAHCPATTTIEPGTALDKSMDKAALEHTHRPSTTHLDRETARDEDVSSKASASLDNPKRVPDVPVSAQDFISRLPEELRDLMFNFLDGADVRKMCMMSRTCRDSGRRVFWRDVRLDLNKKASSVYDSRRDSELDAVAQHILNFTKSLTLQISGNRHPSMLPIFSRLIGLIMSKCELQSLDLEDSQLDEEGWSKLSELLGQVNIQNSICRVGFPGLTEARALKIYEQYDPDRDESPAETYSVAPCNGRLEFDSRGVGTNRTVTISVRGTLPNSLVRQHAGARPALGSDLLPVKRFLKDMGNPTTFHVFDITSAYFRRFSGFIPRLGLASLTISVTVLKLCGLDFSGAAGTALDDLEKVDFSCLKELHLNSCGNLVGLFDKFMQVESLGLKTFVCVNDRLFREDHDDNHPPKIEDFLASFSGLSTLRLLSAGGWNMDFEKVLGTHGDLEEFILRLGRQNFPAYKLSTVHKMCPFLRVLGLQSSGSRREVRNSRGDMEFRSQIKDYARELAHFTCLEELEIIMETVSDAGVSKGGTHRANGRMRVSKKMRLEATAQKIFTICDNEHQRINRFKSPIQVVRMNMSEVFYGHDAKWRDLTDVFEARQIPDKQFQNDCQAVVRF